MILLSIFILCIVAGNGASDNDLHRKTDVITSPGVIFIRQYKTLLVDSEGIINYNLNLTEYKEIFNNLLTLLKVFKKCPCEGFRRIDLLIDVIKRQQNLLKEYTKDKTVYTYTHNAATEIPTLTNSRLEFNQQTIEILKIISNFSNVRTNPMNRICFYFNVIYTVWNTIVLDMEQTKIELDFMYSKKRLSRYIISYNSFKSGLKPFNDFLINIDNESIINLYYEIAHVSVFYMGNGQFELVIHIPLIKKQQHHGYLYSIIPTYTTINQEWSVSLDVEDKKYLLVTQCEEEEEEEEYWFVTLANLAYCEVIENNNNNRWIICHPHFPLHSYRAYQCISAVFNSAEEAILQMCSYKFTRKFNPFFLQIVPGHWVYSIHDNIQLNLLCEDNKPDPNYYQLSPGVDILRLPAGCSAQSTTGHKIRLFYDYNYLIYGDQTNVIGHHQHSPLFLNNYIQSSNLDMANFIWNQTPPIHLIDLYCFSTLYKNIIILGVCSIVIVPIYIVIIVYICYYHCRCLRSSKANSSANIRTRAVSLENNTTLLENNTTLFSTTNPQMATFRPLLTPPPPHPLSLPHQPPPLPINENDDTIYESVPSNYLTMKGY
ncbi:hypothetical protein TCON_2072 [Astathelohania contejeani]|uniref:Uncharacterized protein n=1 Tax=Astathelohania contejeani TaxID=164912 RepID=A0ABQ7HX49_9MICR|nr:hypothetical protein TCON_2072 [Thelohania contejeani]